MASVTPVPSLNEALDRLKGEVSRHVDPSAMAKIGENFSGLWMNAQNLKSDGIARLSSSAVVKILDPPVREIGRNLSACGKNVDSFKSSVVAVISSSVIVRNFTDLRANFQRNVRALTSKGPENVDSLSFMEESSVVDFIPSAEVPYEGDPPHFDESAVPQRPSHRPPPSSISPNSVASSSLDTSSDDMPTHFGDSSVNFASASSSEASPEDAQTRFEHSSSVSATSVFSIGAIGPPLLSSVEHQTSVSSPGDNDGTPAVPMFSGAERAAEGLPEPLVRLEDVRKFVGSVLIASRKARLLRFPESSWENKMPWRNPRPAHLAKGLEWPRTKFSSDRERAEYNRKARRRGRYLIGPTPGWSWFAADVILLYFLINNPAGNFLL